MRPLLEEHGRMAWEFAWAFTGRSDAAASCLALAFRELESSPPPSQEPARRRAVWRALVDACRRQVTGRPPGSPESGDARLAALLALPLELRETILLFRYHGASAEDLGATLGCSPPAAMSRAQRALTRLALSRAVPGP